MIHWNYNEADPSGDEEENDEFALQGVLLHIYHLLFLRLD